MFPQITVVTPTIPGRSQLLMRSQRSAVRQTLPPAALSVAVDVESQGAAMTRQRALEAVRTPWVAFLDDDDIFMPEHLETLYAHAMNTGADMVYSWFNMMGGADPFPPGHRMNEFDPENPIETTITTLCKTDAAQAVGFHALDRGHDANSGEDYAMVLGLVSIGAIIRNVNAGVTRESDVKRTWHYVVHGGNSSGLPTKGDALAWNQTRRAMMGE